MKSKPDGTSSTTMVINATNVGRYLDGISVYTLNILRELAGLQTHLRFIIYVNRACAGHLEKIRFGDNCSVRWIGESVSPDHGFRGQFLRLLVAQWISWKHRAIPLFAASQLESAFFRRRQVIMVHDVIPYLFRRWHKKQYYFFRLCLPFILKKAQAIITPSYHTQGLLQQVFGVSETKLHVIPNGIQREFHPPAKSSVHQRENFILFTGRIAPMKNLKGLLKAFSMIQHLIPHTLVIVGYGKTHRTKLLSPENLASLKIDSQRVVIKGSVSTMELSELYRRAAMVMVPSFYEGFGLPPLEAMASGCPVVASNVSSIPEVCGDSVYYVDPYVPYSIALGMRRVLENPGLKEQLVARGLKQASYFNWRKSAECHLSIFQRVAEECIPERMPKQVRPPAPIFTPGLLHRVHRDPALAMIDVHAK